MGDCKNTSTAAIANVNGLQNPRGTAEIMEPENLRKVFVGGLSPLTTYESFTKYFSKYGTLEASKLLVDNVTKASRQFGFITFSKLAEVDKVMASRPHVLDSKTVNIKRFVPNEHSGFGNSSAAALCNKVYVSDFRKDDCNHVKRALRDYFTQFGTVVKVDVVSERGSNEPRGFAFVTFSDYDPVDRCILQASHKIDGSNCVVKRAIIKQPMGMFAVPPPVIPMPPNQRVTTTVGVLKGSGTMGTMANVKSQWNETPSVGNYYGRAGFNRFGSGDGRPIYGAGGYGLSGGDGGRVYEFANGYGIYGRNAYGLQSGPGHRYDVTAARSLGGVGDHAGGGPNQYSQCSGLRSGQGRIF